LIVDGIHVAPAMLRLALKGAGAPMLVTDAMPNVGGVKKAFTLYGREILVKGERCVTRDGVLAGSGIDMATAVRDCVKLLGIPLADALGFASRAPAEFLGVGNRFGRIAPGYRADMVALDPQEIRVLGTYLAGTYESA
jgi:N-acetylglucosamine-6-phosphate deacetylase